MNSTRKYHRLGKKQLAVISDMYDNGLTRSQALQKNKVTEWLYRKWMANPLFLQELELRIEEAMQQNSLILARVFPRVSKRLSELITMSDKDETSRKACLDLVSLREADLDRASSISLSSMETAGILKMFSKNYPQDKNSLQKL